MSSSIKSLECPECNKMTVEADEQNGQEQMVCRACGIVVSEGSFQQEVGCNAASSYANSKGIISHNSPWSALRHMNKISVSVGKKHGLEKIQLLITSYSIPSSMGAAAIQLYDRALLHPSMLCLHQNNKAGIAAACMYIVMRNNNWPITKVSICDAVQISLSTFQAMSNLIVSNLNIHIDSLSLEEMIPLFLKDADMEDKDEVGNKVARLLQLAKDMWLVFGRKPDGLLSAAAYIAWISCAVIVRHKVKYEQFCKQVGLIRFSAAKARIRELRLVLLKLAAELPWLQGMALKETNVYHHLDDILKYSQALIMSRAKSSSNSLELQPENEEQWNEFVRPLPKKRPRTDTREDSLYPIEVSESIDLTENDLPEKDIGEYIRSADEIKALESLLNINTEQH